MDNKQELWLGDCLELMINIPDESVDCIICDLPFGTTSCKWDTIIPFESLWLQYKRITKKDAAIVLFGTQPFTSSLIMSNPKQFKYEWIWHKSKSGSAFTAKYRPVSKHENILVFGKGKTKYNPQKIEGEPYKRNRVALTDKINNHDIGFNGKGIFSENDGFRYPITIQFFQQKWRRQDQLHPTQKPVEMMEYLIKTYTNENDLVLDNCMGSGTTCLAAKNLNRQFIGIEKEEEYYNIAVKRLNV
jgi:site-specific DNA-methyltransferase (adenine-specific)